MGPTTVFLLAALVALDPIRGTTASPTASPSPSTPSSTSSFEGSITLDERGLHVHGPGAGTLPVFLNGMDVVDEVRRLQARLAALEAPPTPAPTPVPGGPTDVVGDITSCAAAAAIPGGKTRVLGSVRLEQCNGSLLHGQGLLGVTEVTGNVLLTRCSFNLSHTLPALTTVGGNLVIHGAPGLQTLHGLGALASVGGYLYLQENPDLRSLEGLDNLAQLGQLLLVGNPRLASLAGMPRLVSIGGPLTIDRNNALQSLQGLPPAVSLGGDVVVRKNAVLRSLDGLATFFTAAGTRLQPALTLDSNPLLDDLSVLSPLTHMNVFWMEYTNALRNLSALANLETLDGALWVKYCGALESVVLPKLSSVRGIHLQDLDVMVNASLPALVSTSGAIYIRNNDILTSIADLTPNLESFQGAFIFVCYNQRLTGIPEAYFDFVIGIAHSEQRMCATTCCTPGPCTCE